VHLHGDFGTNNTYITDRILEGNHDPTNPVICDAMVAKTCEEYPAMWFFAHANPRQYGSIVATAQNDFVTGVDKYPKTVSKAYDMLVNFVNPNKHHYVDDQDSVMSFLSRGQQSSRQGQR
jgi:hypothetical protein